ncbi:uncharacterized protein F4822DRAFT_429196 [Hypoxylon trugodes]|uniref:uncharacterized protein n=1 Tax=Hypoxylon trugodes TaxID=326681 RepID=UPI00219605F6|nr:uncharacterized protein F4822DRAFT_429196 [Hypoxylon trugodes]KAI1388577.1 hypothetical protein F4822DRAFT_429196 [Hypoxylon trugodes]
MASSPSLPEDDDPPPYIAGNRNDADEILQPTILILAGQFIRAQSADGTPLYELSRDVRASPTSDTLLAQVSLERLIHNVRMNSDGTPRVLHRSKHIFELKHLPSVISTGFPFCLDSKSRNTIGNIALKAASFPRSGCKIVKVRPEKEDGFPKGYNARRESLREEEVVFEVVKKRDHYEWLGPDGNRIAIEDKVEGEHKLIVTTPVRRKTMDAMIGSWCLRIWRDGIKSNRDIWRPFKVEARTSREVLPNWW